MDYSKAKEKVTFTIDAWTAITLHGNVSLALRHPNNHGPSTALARAFLETIEQELVKVGLLDRKDIQLIRRDERGELSQAEYEAATHSGTDG